MKELTSENFDEKLADQDAQKTLQKKRRLTYYERSISKKEFSGETDDNWYVRDETLKTVVKLAKDKSRSEVFEDEVWCILSRLGFKYLSSDRNCAVSYDKKGSTQQLDILAVDDETAVIVECKCADGDTPVKADFLKTEIESISGKKPGLHRRIRELFGNENLKIAYILATKNYIVSKKNLERLDEFNIKHFSDSDLDYYSDLVNHLGTVARYQFQADIFPGQDIPSIQNKVYAIEGKMGTHTYYSFSIEPAKLLKMSYVLHRTKSIKLLPSYQRLIKKNRLKQVSDFVEDGGYFPNSIVLSLDYQGKSPVFEKAAGKVPDSATKMGVLHLPSRYRSAYVIDGQHRLYGYSNSKYAETNAIPIVAFVDLKRKDQLELFMQINENQKSVAKNLKNTLDADLKWDSESLKDRADGLKKQLCQDLGEDVSSPLYGRVLVGEDTRTETKVISLEAILKGLNATAFFGKFTKNEIKEAGIFYTGSNEKTLSIVKEFLYSYFGFFAEELPYEWNRKQSEYGIITINDGVTALIALSSDIVSHMVEHEEVKPLSDAPEEIAEKAKFYLYGVKKYLETLEDKGRHELRTKYGSGAPPRLRRIFQRAIHEERDDFNPPGLQQYWIDQSKQFNVDTYKRIQDIETELRDEIREILIDVYTDKANAWLKKGLPPNLYTQLSTEAAKKNIHVEAEEDEKGPWDCLNLIHIRDIVLHGNHWSTLFQKRFTIPGMGSKKKEEKTKWLVELNRIRNVTDHEYSVSKSDHDYVAALHDWLITGDPTDIRSLEADDSPDSSQG